MRAFLLILFGQVVSMMGTQLTAFGLGVKTYLQTDSATLYGMIVLATLAPQVVAAPMGGRLVDRWNRRHVLIAGHLGAGVCSLVIALLLSVDALALWSMLLLIALASMMRAAEFPAISALTTLLVPPQSLGRANGLMQLGLAIAQIASLFGAGFLLRSIDLIGILIINVVTFSIAIAILLLVKIPLSQPAAATDDGKKPVDDSGTLQSDFLLGWKYITERRGLFGLLLFVSLLNFTIGMVQVLITPLVLGFSDERVLGVVSGIGGIGMLVGGLAITVWGSPKRLVKTLLTCALVQGMLLALGGLQPSVLLIGIGAFGVLGVFPIIAACSQTLWQRKVPVEKQGRVFAVRVMVSQSTMPIAALLSGPLVDGVFEPLMAKDGALANTVGRLLGVGQGRGAALLFVVLALITVLAVLVATSYTPLRRLQEELPDSV